MAKYLQLTFYTVKGIKKIIDLGEFSHGEWIVYDANEPRYFVNLHTENKSDMMVNSQINKGLETIESIISKINIKQGLKLRLADMPLIRLIKKEEHVELELIPLPLTWLKDV